MKTVIEMAREAGLVGGPVYARGLERFAELVRADEREACAKVCETFDQREMFNDEDMAVANACAAAIRARGNT